MNTATDAQTNYIDTLLTQREVPEVLRKAIAGNTLPLTSVAASVIITTLRALPFARPVEAARPATPDLAGIPLSKYAIPTLEIPGDAGTRGDLLFVEVKNYRGSVYMRRLTGNVGGFSRTRMPAAEIETLAAIVRTNPLRYTQLFGAHYGVCGCCGAELTDEMSRSLLLGPVCRKRFNL